ncbi:MAG TPA: hypothetical protein VG389_27740, partial [Myxococcota bacterium]|nr:hypothetical protein [Myxococcota bacterium]
AALLYELLDGEEAHPLPLTREAMMSKTPPTTPPPDAPGLYRNTDPFDLLRSLMGSRNWDESLKLLDVMEGYYTEGPLYDLLVGYLEHTRMRWTHALTALHRAMEASAPPKGPLDVHLCALYYLARTHWYYLDYPEAFKAMSAYLDLMTASGRDLPLAPAAPLR